MVESSSNALIVRNREEILRQVADVKRRGLPLDERLVLLVEIDPRNYTGMGFLKHLGVSVSGASPGDIYSAHLSRAEFARFADAALQVASAPVRAPLKPGTFTVVVMAGDGLTIGALPDATAGQ